jgi:copper chaperone
MAMTLKVRCPAIECDGCVNAIKRAMSKLPGIESVEVDVENKAVTVMYDEGEVTEAALLDRLASAGFPAG